MNQLVSISRELSAACDALTFYEPVAYVYNPLDYARVPHERYVERYGRGKKQVLLLGMNPGPFGMMQTGVPFGDIAMVRDFLGIEGPVEPVPGAHPKRPIEGFACTRSEVSGTRLWGYVRDRFGTADAFFERFFVANYCPLVFLEEGAKNRTPDKLSAAEQASLYAPCDHALRRIVEALGVELVVGVGAFAENRARLACGDRVRVGTILHPSPASPAANRGWAAQAEKQLRALGVAD